MVTLAFLLAACLDPVQAALVLVIILACPGAQSITVAGVVAAVVSETIMMLAVADYAWGELIAPRLVAAVLQAAALFWLVSVVRNAARSIADEFRSRRRRSDRANATRAPAPPPGNDSAAARSLAPWQMRALARHRIDGLRGRKLQP